MPLPIIHASSPVEVKQESEVFPYYWITSLLVSFPDCNKDGHAMVNLRPYRLLEDGSREFAPLPSVLDGSHGNLKKLMIPKILEESAGNQKIQEAMKLILEAVNEKLNPQQQENEDGSGTEEGQDDQNGGDQPADS